MGTARVIAAGGPSAPAFTTPNRAGGNGRSDPRDHDACCTGALRVELVFRVRFVIGPSFENRDQTAQAIVALNSNFETIEGADDLTTEYASADWRSRPLDASAYELAAFGVPALYLCATEDHAQSASAFEHAGMGISLGVAQLATDRAIAKAVWALLGDQMQRREMRTAALMTIDGSGAQRIAGDLAKLLVSRRASGPSRLVV